MKYKVLVTKNTDGFTAQCPALRGCWSQGETEEEALENIRSAIEEYLLAIGPTKTPGYTEDAGLRPGRPKGK